MSSRLPKQGVPAAAELADLLDVADAHGLAIDRVRLSSGVELVLSARLELASPAAPPVRKPDESDGAYQERSAQSVAKAARVKTLSREFGEGRARRLADLEATLEPALAPVRGPQ